MTFIYESNWGDERMGSKLQITDHLHNLTEKPLSQHLVGMISTENGDGDGEYITYKQTDPTTGEVIRIVGVELTFSDNKFGDKSQKLER